MLRSLVITVALSVVANANQHLQQQHDSDSSSSNAFAFLNHKLVVFDQKKVQNRQPTLMSAKRKQEYGSIHSPSLLESALSENNFEMNNKKRGPSLDSEEPIILRQGIFTKSRAIAQSFRRAYGAKNEFVKTSMHALLSYTIVASTFVVGQFVVSWYGFCVKTGMSPLEPGGWKGFLAVYAQLAALSVALSPIVKVALAKLLLGPTCRLWDASQRHLKTSSSAATLSYLLVLVNVAMVLLIALGVVGASIASGVPLFRA